MRMTTQSLAHTHLPFGAIRDVGFAVDAGEARPAGAGVGVDIVCARAAVFAGGTLAFVDL